MSVNISFGFVIPIVTKNYYNKEYGRGRKEKIEKTDSTIEITYYEIPEKNDAQEYFTIAIYISRVKDKLLFDANTFLEGDLNNDKLQDLVVSVHTEGGGTGGNGLWWNDLFVFLNQKEHLILNSVISNDITCNGNNGHFFPRKIEDGYLVGNSNCYDSEDPTCCPSLNYSTKGKLINNKLSFQNKFKNKINSE